MKKIVLFSLCSLLLVGIITGCKQKPQTEDKTETTKVDVKADLAKDKYIKMAKEANAKMPKVVPGGLRQDKEEAVSKNEYKYYYTFTQDPAISSEEFIRSSKPTLTLALQAAANADDIKSFRKDKMTLIFAYHKMDGTLFAEIVVTPQEYSNK